MAVQTTTPGELVQLRAAGRLAWGILQQVAAEARAGVQTVELAARAEQLIGAAGAVATTKGFTFGSEPPFPGAASISVNDQVMFGLPDARALQEGDVVTIDLTLRTALGWHADVATSVAVGSSERATRLVDAARTAVDEMIAAIGPGVWWSSVMAQSEAAVGARGLFLLPGAVGHGIGHEMHEQPGLYHGRPEHQDVRLRPGQVIAIEPVVIERPSKLVMAMGQWTASTDTGAWAAFEERMVAVTAQGAELLTR